MKTIRWLSFLILVIGLTLFSGWAARGQKEPPAEKNNRQGAGLRFVRAGYTRPGKPNDQLNKNGTLRPIAWDADFQKKKIIGGTIYFLVLERTGAEGDAWGTGFKGFDNRFVEGKNYKNQFSPALDTQAKYLYLYQIVNDRGLDPSVDNIKPAAFKELPTVPIAAASLKMPVDPRYLTSWGHFKGTGFVATVPDRDRQGEIRFAAGKTPTEIRLAVSANPSILAELPERKYQDPCPAYALKKLASSLGFGSSVLNLKLSASYAQLSNKQKNTPALLAAYEKDLLLAADSAREPDFVQLLYSGYEEDAAKTPLLSGQKAQSFFRADWKGKSPLGLGFHSTVFGFTTDLAPGEGSMAIEEPGGRLGAKAMTGAGRPDDPGFVAAQDPDLQLAQVPGGVPAGGLTASGTALSPVPPAPPPVVAGAGAGILGGGLAGFPGGAGFAGGGAAGGLGSAFPGFFGGGGGTGGGQGQSSQSQVTKPVSVNVTLKNQQSQSQLQTQAQTQTQGGSAVPEPAAIFLGLLGLAALIWVGRRYAGR